MRRKDFFIPLIICMCLLSVFCSGCTTILYKSVFEEEVELGSDLKQVELHEARWYPFCGIEKLVLPIPMRTDKIIKQTLFFKGEEIWSTRYEWKQRHEYTNFYLSPNGRFVYIEACDRLKSSVVLNLNNKKIIPINLPYEISHHGNKFPMRFDQWRPDSSGIITISDDEYIKFEGGLYSYNGEWLIDPQTGNVTIIWAEKGERTEIGSGFSHKKPIQLKSKQK